MSTATRYSTATALAAFLALSTACGGGGGGSSPAPQPAVTISVAGATTPLTVGTTRTYTATVGNSSNTSVTWSVVEAGGGTISAAGVYTAPATAGTYTVKATSAADTSKTATASVNVINAATQPTITAPTVVTAGLAGYTASVAAQTGCTYTWSVTNGTLTAGAGTTAITFTPGTTGTVDLSCVVSNAAGTPSAAGTASIAIADAPTATGLTVSTASPAFGATVSLTPTFAGGTATIGTTGAGSSDISASATSGVAITTPAITAGVTYTLTVTNAAGDTATATSATVTPQTVAVGVPTTSNLSVTAAGGSSNTSRTFTASVTGAASSSVTWSVDNIAGGNSTVGTITSGGVYSAGSALGTHTVKATSVSDTSKSNSATVTVVAAPAATSCVASSASPLYGATITVTPTFSNGTAKVGTSGSGSSDLSASATSGTAITTAALTTPKTYTLTVTNAAGTVATAASATVTPQTVTVSVPTTSNLNVTAAGGADNTSRTFAASASGGVSSGVTWAVDNVSGGNSTVGTISSGGVYSAGTALGAHVVKATSVSDTSKSNSATITVVGAPVATSCVASSASPLYGDTITVTPTFSFGTATVGTSGAGSSDLSASPVSGTPITTAALTTGQTYTLTVTNAAGTVATAASAAVAPQTVSVSTPTTSNLNVTVAGGASNTSRTFSATASNALDTTLTWSVDDIAGGNGTVGTISGSGVYSSGTALGAHTVKATSVADNSKSASATITVVGVPVATSCVASSASPLYGDTITVTPTFSFGTATVGTTGSGSSDLSASPTSGSAITTGALTTAKTYTLTVTNAAGTVATVASAAVTPQTVAVSTPTTSNLNVTVAGGLDNTSRTFTATANNAADASVTWSVDNIAGGNSTVGTINGSGVYSAGSALGAHAVKATSVADSSKSASATVTVVAVPSAAFTPTTYRTVGDTSLVESATAQPGSTFAWTLTGNTGGNTGAITSGAATSNVTFDAGSPAGAFNLNLTVTNAAGTADAVSHAVTVVAAPVATSLGASLATVLNGDKVTLTPTFSAGTATIGTGGSGSSQVTASATTGVGVLSTAVTGSTTFTLTVTNLAGATATTTATVNPGATTYSGTGSLTVARQRHSAIELANGTILIVGGSNVGDTFGADGNVGHTDMIYGELYTPSTGLFAETTGTLPLGQGRKFHIAVANSTKDKVLIAGGIHAATDSLGTGYVYDQSGQSFTAANNAMVLARENHGAVLLTTGSNAGKVLIMGGQNTVSGSSTLTTSMELFDFSTGMFSSLVPATGTPALRNYPVLTRLNDGRILITGGRDGSATELNTAEIYDPVANTIAATSNTMTDGRSFHTATVLQDGKVLVAGGNFTTASNTADLFDPAAASGAGAFTQVGGTSLGARYGHTAALLPDGKVLISGGHNGTNALTTVVAYDPVGQTFAATAGPAALATARRRATATLINTSKVLVVGGEDGTNGVTSAEVYQ